MSAANKAVVRRFIEGYQTGHDERVARECLADDFVNHSPFGPFTADKRNPIEFDVIDILAVRDGQMREHWNVVDALTLMTQVGAVPAPG